VGKAPGAEGSYISASDTNGGFSNEYTFTNNLVVHVHRRANGNARFAQVKPAHLKGAVHAGEQIPLNSLADYGIPFNDTYTP
jgi:hypothetical protein